MLQLILPLFIAVVLSAPPVTAQVSEGDANHSGDSAMQEESGISSTDLAVAAIPDTVDLQEVLLVGTKVAPPFSMKRTDGEWEGISIDLWKNVADELGLHYRFVERDLKGLIDGVADPNDSLDVAIAAITITSEREAQLDFSHPYYESGLGIAARAGGDGSWFGVARRLFSLEFFSAIGALLLVLFLVGVLIWAVERKKNPEQFGGKPHEGIGNGFWWSAVTMTTVGYGDKAPVTFLGRAIGLVWMFAAIIIISSFTAAIAASLTVSELSTDVSGPGDLPKVTVGSTKGSTGATYLSGRGISPEAFESVEDGMNGLVDKEIDAFVYDAPMLRYLTNMQFSEDLVVLPETFDKQFYGIALPNNSPLREPINRALLTHAHGAGWNELVSRYLGE